MIYQWRDTFSMYTRIDAQRVGEHLDRLRTKGALTPKAVVADAKKKTAPTHPCFEWENGKAAGMYREHQARMLLGNIVAIIQPDTDATAKSIRAFVHVHKDGEPQYERVQTALSDEKIREQVLADALGELNSWRSRYQELRELARIFSAIDSVQGEFEIA